MTGVLLALTLGLRHGIDPDHLAAISDIATVKKSVRGTIRQSFGYALGHAVVVLVFVVIAMLIGSAMPDWFGMVSSWLVGCTLIAMGIWVLASLGDSLPRTRGHAVRAIIDWVGWRKPEAVGFEHEHDHVVNEHSHGDYPYDPTDPGGMGSPVLTKVRHRHAHRHIGFLPGTPAPFVVGMAHGFGAETPTQIALLSAAAGSGAVAAVALGVAFVVGLIVANMGVAVVAALGATGAKHSRLLTQVLTLGAGVASIWVGALALLGP